MECNWWWLRWSGVLQQTLPRAPWLAATCHPKKQTADMAETVQSGFASAGNKPFSTICVLKAII